MSKFEMDESERKIFDPFNAEYGSRSWNGLIILRGGSFNSLKWIGKEIGRQIGGAEKFSHLPITGGGNGGSHESSHSFSCLFTSPVEMQIVELRRKAAELEKALGDKTAPVRREYT